MSKNKKEEAPSIGNFPVDQQVISKILDNQTKALVLQDKELSLRELEAKNNHVIAEKSIAAEADDRKDSRNHSKELQSKRFWLILIGIIAIAVFSIYALFLGKENLIMKMFEIVAIFFAGFAGGYGYKAFSDPVDKDSDKQ